MSNLFDKIATLVNAQVNDLLGMDPTSPLARIRLNADEAEKHPRRSAQALRQRLDEAVDYEDELQAKINDLMRQASDLDALVDASVQHGDQFGARRLQGQLNMKQQQLSIAESELRDHRAVTRHLMQEMHTLESALDSQDGQAAPRSAGGATQKQRTRIPIEGAGPRGARHEPTIVDAVSEKLNEARDGLDSLLNRQPAQETPEITRPGGGIVIVDEEPDPRQPKPRKQDPGDMDRRLSRLSKPGDDLD